jgi:eukaryotic-like serine/threonine-protein kinase
MIAAPTPKPETTARERLSDPVPENEVRSGFCQGFAAMIVDTLTRLHINKLTPRRSDADSERPRGSTLAATRLKAGHELGSYRLLEWLGRGGEGDVWKAVRLETASELVALKILNPNLANNPARKAQFRREAERGTGLIGPSLLTVHELNEIDGYHFMTFPYVEATTLRDIIKRRYDYLSNGDVEKGHPFVTMREDEYLGSMTRTLAKAAHALASVHDQRIVHRDVKPANILMDNRRREGAYLCDFGLGRDLDVATSEQMRDGAGTPLYMAPERLLRFAADEIKCDIYSMGVTLCEALTLKRPFQVPEDLPLPALAPFLATTEPTHPRALDPELPEALAAIITKAMARDPRQRHTSIRDLAGELDHFAADWSLRCRAHTLHHPYRPSASRAHALAERVMVDVGRAPLPGRAAATKADGAPDPAADPFSVSRAD